MIYKVYKYNESMLDACAKIFLDVYTGEEFNFEFLTIDNVKEYFHSMYKKEDFEGFVYVQNNEILAVCLGKDTTTFGNRIYEISEICVSNAFRGKGVGKSFMKEIEKTLRKQKYLCIQLSTKRTINAYNFYLKNGFIEKDDVVSMMKTL